MAEPLTTEQLGFFKENGYLIVPSLLNRALCAKARGLLWASLPEDADIRRDDPDSHIGPFPEKDVSEDPLNWRVGFRWQIRRHSTDEDMIRLVYNDKLMRIAKQLLGGELREPVAGGARMGSQGPAWPNGPIDPAQNSEGIRGIYATLPFPDDAAKAHPDSNAHTDGHPFMLSVVGLIDDCPEGGGAFTVWPGSHRRLFHKCEMRYDKPRIPFYDHMPSYKGLLESKSYLEELTKILNDTEPVECSGNAGDVVFWHHRMVHCAGENHSKVIRQAVLGDLNREDLDNLRLGSPDVDMWQDWSTALQNL